MTTKLFILILFALFSVCVNELQSQDLVSIKLQSTEINGNTFNNSYGLEIANNSLDTIFIILEPFEFETIGKSNMSFANMLHNKFAPCRIVFFKKPLEGCIEGTSGSNISYLKFPKILEIKPVNKTIILLKFEDAIKDLLRENIWDVYCEITYAFKGDLRNAFNLKKSVEISLEEQFESSLFNIDTIKVNISMLNLRDSNPILISDSSLYFYKDGENVKKPYISDYDYIISFFKNQIYNFINRN